MDGDDEFTSAGSRLARLKASANAAASQMSLTHNVDDIIESLGAGGTKKKNNNDDKGPSPPKTRKIKELVEKPEKLSSDDEEDSLLDSSQETLLQAADCADESVITSDDEEVVSTHHRKNAKEHTNRAAFFRRREMNISLDEHKHILTYLDGSKQQESESSPGKGGDFSSEVTVKVRWNFGLVQKHQVRRLQPLRALFEEYAAKEGVSLEQVVFELLERRVSPDETPDALGLTVATILSGYKVARKLDTSILSEAEDQEQMLEIKVQMVDRRADKITVRLRPFEPMAKAYCAVAETLGVDAGAVRLVFEGDTVQKSATAELLELEGGEVFDCVLESADIVPSNQTDDDSVPPE